MTREDSIQEGPETPDRDNSAQVDDQTGILSHSLPEGNGTVAAQKQPPLVRLVPSEPGPASATEQSLIKSSPEHTLQADLGPAEVRGDEPTAATRVGRRHGPPGDEPPVHELHQSTQPNVDDVGHLFLIDTFEGELAGAHVVIVGGGAVGLWVAFYAVMHGAKVTVIDDGMSKTFLIAAGWLWPYHATDPLAAPLSVEAIRLWKTHAGWMGQNTLVKEYTEVQRGGLYSSPFPDALRQFEGFRYLEKRVLAPGLKEGVAAMSYVAPAAIWYPILHQTLVDWGVEFVNETVDGPHSFYGLEGDFVVNAAGVRSAFLLDDDTFQPLRGTVAHLKIPEGFEGVWAWDLGDNGNMDPYAISQRALSLVVAGGETTPVPLQYVRDFIDNGCPPETLVGEMILERLYQFAPVLRGAEVLDIKTGIRPGRDRMMLMTDVDDARVLHASGFGGFGVTVAPAVGVRVVNTMIASHRFRRRVR